MKQYTYSDAGFTFERVTRTKAKAAYNNGLRVVLCPCNLRPCYPFHPESSISGKAAADFETQENAFIYYNCTSKETGRRPAYYIPVRLVDAFTGDTPTADTLHRVKQYDYRYIGENPLQRV